MFSVVTCGDCARWYGPPAPQHRCTLAYNCHRCNPLLLRVRSVFRTPGVHPCSSILYLLVGPLVGCLCWFAWHGGRLIYSHLYR